MTSPSLFGRKQTGKCWILRRPSAAEVWPMSHTPSAGWRRWSQIHPPSRRRSHRWRSSSVWSPDAGQQSLDRSWRWPAMLSLPSPFNRTEIFTNIISHINLTRKPFFCKSEHFHTVKLCIICSLLVIFQLRYFLYSWRYRAATNYCFH